MLLKKQTAKGESDRQVAVAEPRPGYDAGEVARGLRALGASRIEALAPGFVPATLGRRLLGELEDSTEVGIRPRQRPLGATR